MSGPRITSLLAGLVFVGATAILVTSALPGAVGTMVSVGFATYGVALAFIYVAVKP